MDVLFALLAAGAAAGLVIELAVSQRRRPRPDVRAWLVAMGDMAHSG